jgi:hypothetical protein
MSQSALVASPQLHELMAGLANPAFVVYVGGVELEQVAKIGPCRPNIKDVQKSMSLEFTCAFIAILFAIYITSLSKD